MSISSQFLRRIWPAIRSTRLSLIAVFAAIGWGVSYAIEQEPATGTVQGTVRLADSGALFAEARITLSPTSGGYRRDSLRKTWSRSDGSFVLSAVKEGTYSISAYTDSHHVDGGTIYVNEGEATHVELNLDRSNPDIALSQHQWTFSTSENPRIAIRGYTDSTKAKGTDSVKLTVYKTRLSSMLINAKTAEKLEEVGRGWDAPPGLPDELLKPTHCTPPTKVQDRDLTIKGPDREGFYFQRINFDKMGPGLYLVNVTHDEHILPANPPVGTSVCAWVLVSDTALVLKHSTGAALAYVVDMQSGTPISGAKINQYRAGKIVASTASDNRGLAEMKTQKKEGDERLTIVASRGDDEAVVGQNEYRDEDKGDYAVHSYTDRPIYRPGQLVFFKSIIRRKLDSNARYAVPAGQKVDVEVRDPTGETVLSKSLTCNSYGSVFGQVQLNPESPTGIYSMIVGLGAEKHTEYITVASYRKPEFTVTVTPARTDYVRGDEVEAAVDAQFYFGAPVAGATVHFSVYRSPDWSSMYAAEDEEDYKKGEDEEGEGDPYVHDSGGERYYGQDVTDGDVTLDDNGRATIRFRADFPDEPDAPQEQQFTISVSVKDESEREVNSTASLQVTSGDIRIAMRPEGHLGEPGKPSTVVISAKDLQGKAASGVQVQVEPSFERWRHGEFTSEKLPKQFVTTGPDGKGVLMITPAKSGELRLFANARDARGHTIHARIYLWVASDAGAEMDTEYANLSLLTDKRRYLPGDTARVLINSKRTGQTVLLTVEGSRIYRTMLVPMNSRSSVVRVPVLEEYGPNVFLSACCVRDKKFARSESTLRVSLPNKKLIVKVTPIPSTSTSTTPNTQNPTPSTQRPTPNTQHPTPNAQHPTPNALPRYHPGDPIQYLVSTTDKAGKPVSCEFSMGVVDEAIYALKEDSPGAIRDSFYPTRRNAVSTDYSFAVQFLGDSDKAEPKIVSRKRFPDTVYWKADLRTGPDGRATVGFNFQDSLTTWRATAIAHSSDTSVGYDTTKVIVSKDFFVRVELPRFLTQHDMSRIQAIVHNETGARQTTLVRLRTDNLSIKSQEQQTVIVEPGKTAQVFWLVEAAGTEPAKVTVTAWTPKIAGQTQFTDGVEMMLPIRPHGREVFTSLSGELASGKPETEIVRLDPGAIPQSSRLTIRITPSIASSISGALDYLIGYPYGCTEQTMSRFLPDVLVQKILKRMPGMLAEDKAAKLPEMVRNGLARLYKFQHKTGAWGWWEYDNDDPWMTAYVLYGLGSAKSQGYSVSHNVLQHGIDAAIKMLSQAKPEERAFLLYAVALAGNKNAALENRGAVQIDAKNPTSLAYAVLLNLLLGDPPLPPNLSTSTLFGLLGRAGTTDSVTLHWSQKDEWYDRHDLSATATALRAMIAVDPNDTRIASVLHWLMAHRTGDYWYCTKDTSVVLAALADYLNSRPPESGEGEIKISINGAPYRSVTMGNASPREPELVVRIPSVALRAGKNDIRLERTTGSGTVFYSLQLRQTVASEDMAATAPTGYTITREYRRIIPGRDSEYSWRVKTEPTNNSLKNGDRIQVRLTIDAPKDMAYVLIEDPFPSGCEATERGTADQEIETWSFWYSNVDVRDDRIAFFARTMPAGKHVLEYNLRAQTPGQCHVLPTVLESMYAPEMHAESAETRVEVK